MNKLETTTSLLYAFVLGILVQLPSLIELNKIENRFLVIV